MCRWFAYFSVEEECLLEDVLVTPNHGLSKMVHDHYLPGLIHSGANDDYESKQVAARNIMLNIDGMGLAWYTDAQADFTKGCNHLRPAMYKSISPPSNDFNFRSLSANTSTRVLFAHIRASSGGAVTPVNCHPFIFGRHSLMHNGSVSHFTDIRRDIAALLDRDAYAAVCGASDSEHFAALYMTTLTGGRGRSSWDESFKLDEMVEALTQSIGTIIGIQQKILGKDARPSSLNVATTDGYRVVCFRFRNHGQQQPPSLYWSTNAGQTLNRKYPENHDGSQNPYATKDPDEHGRHLIVASEPTTYKEADWTLIGRNSYVAMDGADEVIHQSIPYPDSWDFEDDS